MSLLATASIDLYDDVIAAPAGGNGGVSTGNSGDGSGDTTSPNEETNGSAPYHQLGNNIQPNQIGRRHQLYVGNLTWVRDAISVCFPMVFPFSFSYIIRMNNFIEVYHIRI